MTGGDRGLDLIRPRPPSTRRRVDESDALVDAVAVPARPVLVGEQDQLPALVEPRGAARVDQEQQREQPGHLRLIGQQLEQHSGQTDRLIAEVSADQERAG